MRGSEGSPDTMAAWAGSSVWGTHTDNLGPPLKAPVPSVARLPGGALPSRAYALPHGPCDLCPGPLNLHPGHLAYEK